MVDLRGTPEIAEGELMRFLAETPWYPTRLRTLDWQPVDANTAKATLQDHGATVTLCGRTPESTAAALAELANPNAFGIAGKLPVAMIAFSNLMVPVLAPSSFTVFGPVKTALVPVRASTPRPLQSMPMPPVSLPTTFCWTKFCSFGRSIFGSPKEMPCSAASLVSSINLARCSKAFEGIQPRFRQTPPRRGSESTSITFTPWSSWTWYGSEYDPGERLFFGVVVGLVREFGYFYLDELERVTGPGGLRIERDLYWSPRPLKDCH